MIGAVYSIVLVSWTESMVFIFIFGVVLAFIMVLWIFVGLISFSCRRICLQFILSLRYLSSVIRLS